MRGFPKHINSKADIENLMATYDRELWLPFLQKLLDSEYMWFVTSKLEDDDEGTTDDTHRVRTDTNDENTTTRYQEEYMANPTCKMYRMGLTREEVEAYMAE